MHEIEIEPLSHGTLVVRTGVLQGMNERDQALNLSEFLCSSKISGLGRTKAEHVATYFNNDPDMLLDESISTLL